MNPYGGHWEGDWGHWEGTGRHRSHMGPYWSILVHPFPSRSALDCEAKQWR